MFPVNTRIPQDYRLPYCSDSWSWCYPSQEKGAQVRRMCQESIASTRWARRESHGKIGTLRRHSLRGYLVFGSGKVRLFQTWISLLAISTLVRWNGVVSATAAVDMQSEVPSSVWKTPARWHSSNLPADVLIIWHQKFVPRIFSQLVSSTN